METKSKSYYLHIFSNTLSWRVTFNRNSASRHACSSWETLSSRFTMTRSFPLRLCRSLLISHSRFVTREAIAMEVIFRARSNCSYGSVGITESISSERLKSGPALRLLPMLMFSDISRISKPQFWKWEEWATHEDYYVSLFFWVLFSLFIVGHLGLKFCKILGFPPKGLRSFSVWAPIGPGRNLPSMSFYYTRRQVNKDFWLNVWTNETSYDINLY